METASEQGMERTYWGGSGKTGKSFPGEMPVSGIKGKREGGVQGGRGKRGEKRGERGEAGKRGGSSKIRSGLGFPESEGEGEKERARTALYGFRVNFKVKRSARTLPGDCRIESREKGKREMIRGKEDRFESGRSGRCLIESNRKRGEEDLRKEGGHEEGGQWMCGG